MADRWLRGAGRTGAGLLAAGLALLPAAGRAAPFCVATEAVPPRCLYADASACEAEAQREHGYCVGNPDQVLPQVGGSQYCVAAGGMSLDCTFRDRSACERAASRSHTACLSAPVAPQPGPPDPFSLRRPS